VLLLRYFGSAIAGDMVAMATMATTFAVVGPLVAGWSADNTGSFIPVFLVLAGLLALSVVITALFLRPPVLNAAQQPKTNDDAGIQPPGELLNAAE
jgi:cyanate permease